MSDLKNRICLYIMILMQCLIMTNCGLPYCKKTQFTEEELKWMEAYNVGDMYIFMNQNNGLQDTIHIDNSSICNPRNTFLFDVEGCNWMEDDNDYNAIATYMFRINHNGVSYPGVFTIEKKKCNSPAEISVLVLDNVSCDVPCNNIVKTYLNKSQYITGVKFHTNQLEQYNAPASLEYIIWNKGKGLVAYKFIGDHAPYILNERL